MNTQAQNSDALHCHQYNGPKNSKPGGTAPTLVISQIILYITEIIRHVTPRKNIQLHTAGAGPMKGTTVRQTLLPPSPAHVVRSHKQRNSYTHACDDRVSDKLRSA